MPAERKPKTLRIDLAQLITQQIEIHDVIIKRSHDMAESKFMKRVRDEGLSYKEQLEFLQSKKCDDIQGYYFSKPLLIEDLKIFCDSE